MPQPYPYTARLLVNRTITTPETFVSDAIALPAQMSYLAIMNKFTYGSGGTACKVYIQTSLDNGNTWGDIACFANATATQTKVSACSSYVALSANSTLSDGALTDNTILNGCLGDRIRVKIVVTGTYAGNTSVLVSAVPR